VRISYAEPLAPPEPTPEIVERLDGHLDDELAFDGLSGAFRHSAERQRAAVRQLEGVDPCDLLVSGVGGGRPVAEALRVAWNHPRADHRALVVALYQRLGLSYREVSMVLHNLGVGPIERHELLENR